MPHLTLKSVYESWGAVKYLYELLGQRKPEESISHKAMPSFSEHRDFYLSMPYLAWYLVEIDGLPVGAVYLTKQREIGVWIQAGRRGAGYARAAVRELMAQHPGKFLANIAPGNEVSAAMFKSLGFGLIQHTYEKE